VPQRGEQCHRVFAANRLVGIVAAAALGRRDGLGGFQQRINAVTATPAAPTVGDVHAGVLRVQVLADRYFGGAKRSKIPSDASIQFLLRGHTAGVTARYSL